MLSPGNMGHLSLPLLLLTGTIITTLLPFTLAYDPCGPSTPRQAPDAPSTCTATSVWAGGMNGLAAPSDSYYNFSEAVVGQSHPINPIDCQYVIPALCQTLTDPNMPLDVWQWRELGGCRVGMIVPGHAGAAPKINVDKCQWKIFYPMLQDAANWGIPKKYYGPTTFGQVNLAFINIVQATGSGTGFPSSDTVKHVFPQEKQGILFNPGYPAYILEYPATN